MASILLWISPATIVLGLAVAVLVTRKKMAVSWAVYGLGAAAFIAAQIVHIPVLAGLQALLKPLAPSLGSATLLAVNVAILGGTAGLFEELARYLVMRNQISRFRRWQDAIGFGFGHGGIEALLLAVISGVQSSVLLAHGDEIIAKLQTVAPNKVEVVAAQLAFIRGLTFGSALIPLWERAIAVWLHLAFSILVWRAVRQRRFGWVILAIFWHAAIDGLAVVMVKSKWTPVHIELTLTALSIFSVLTVVLTWAKWRAPLTPSLKTVSPEVTR